MTYSLNHFPGTYFDPAGFSTFNPAHSGFPDLNGTVL